MLLSIIVIVNLQQAMITLIVKEIIIMKYIRTKAGYIYKVKREALYEDGIDYDARRHIKSILRAGEVAFYELHLSLNELGNAFLTTHKKLNELKIYKEVKSSIRENHEYIDLESVFKNKHPFKE